MVSKNPDFKDSEGMVADTSNPDTQEPELHCESLFQKINQETK